MKKFQFKDIYQSPLKMAIVVIGILIVCQLLFLALKPLAPDLMDERSPWVVTVAILLFFILFNSISTFASDNLIKNWSESIYAIALLGAVGYGISYLISGKTIGQLDGFRDIIMIVLIGFFALKTIATSIKGVVLITKEKDKLNK